MNNSAYSSSSFRATRYKHTASAGKQRKQSSQSRSQQSQLKVMAEPQANSMDHSYLGFHDQNRMSNSLYENKDQAKKTGGSNNKVMSSGGQEEHRRDAVNEDDSDSINFNDGQASMA